MVTPVSLGALLVLLVQHAAAIDMPWPGSNTIKGDQLKETLLVRACAAGEAIALNPILAG